MADQSPPQASQRDSTGRRRRGGSRLLPAQTGLLVALLLWWVPQAWAQPAGQLVLLPTAAQQLELAFAATPEGWSLPDAQVSQQHVQGQACKGDVCLTFGIDAPDARCDKPAVPAGCIRVTGGSPAQAAELTHILAGLPDVWARVTANSPKPAPPVQRAPAWPPVWPMGAWGLAVALAMALGVRKSPWAAWVGTVAAAVIPPVAWHMTGGLRPWWQALDTAYAFHRGAAPRFASIAIVLSLIAWFVLPLALGMPLGWLLRRLQRRFWRTTLAISVPLAIAGVASVVLLTVPLWDALGMAALCALVAGWLAERPKHPLAQATVAGVTTGLSLLMLEGALRVFLPAQPIVAPAESSPFFAPAGESASGGLAATVRIAEPGFCVPWQGRNWPDPQCIPVLEERQAHVLHLGDSCLQGANVRIDERVTSVLDRAQPQVAHINTGKSGTSLDTQAHIARAWLAKQPVDALLIHAYPCNDLVELDSARTYCGDAPLLRYDGDKASFHCDAPTPPASPLKMLLAYSPPPLPLHWATYDSLLARALMQPFDNIGRRQPPAQRDPEVARAHYAAALQLLLQEAGKRHVPVAAVLLPVRDSACPTRARADAQTLREVFQSAHVPLLDTVPIFDAEVARSGEASVFVDQPRGDTHPNAQSQARLAREILTAWPTLFPSVRLP